MVGSESVGKSSLLEKVAGMDFFPRGENVTTRLGFRLRLHRCTARLRIGQLSLRYCYMVARTA